MCERCDVLEARVIELSSLLMETGVREVKMTFAANATFSMDGKLYTVASGDTFNIAMQPTYITN